MLHFSYVTEKTAKVALDFWVDGEFIVVHHCEYCIQVHEFTVVRKFEGQYFLEANVLLEDVYQQFFN